MAQALANDPPSKVNNRHSPDKFRKPPRKKSLQFRYLPQRVVKVRDVTSLVVVFPLMVVSNDYQRNCNDLKTTRDGLSRYDNVNKMRPAVSNEIWTESQRKFLPSQNFQHVENLPTDATENFGRLRPLTDRPRQVKVTNEDRRQIQNSIPQVTVAFRYPLSVLVWERLYKG